MTNDTLLNKVKSYYESAVNAPAYQKWLQESEEAWRFYDGNQWSDDEVNALHDKGQPAIVINKIASKIDNIAGSEIAGRTRVIYRSRSGDKAESKTARALTDLGLYIAERTEQAMEISSVFKEGLVTGISWMDVGLQSTDTGREIYNYHETAGRVVWDSTFTRLDYSDARFVCRERWLDEESLKTMFPNTSDTLLEGLKTQTFGIPLNSMYGIKNDGISYIDAENNRIRVVEVQYRKSEKRYRVTTPKGKIFTTFDKDVAYAHKLNKVESDFYPRVYIAYFSDNVLLEHNPLPYLHNKFSLIPFVYKRDSLDGRPYGIIRGAMDPQRELNKRRSKAMHLLNTAQVIADVDAVDDPNILAREAARPDGIILKRPGKDLRILRNTDLAASQVSVMDHASRDLQEVIGVFDESIGKHSNATSGIAIQQRQMAGSMNHMFAFDALRRLKKTLGGMVLSLMRQFYTAHMVINITDSLDAPRVISLNETALDMHGDIIKDERGEPVKVNDVSSGIYDVHVDEVKDVLSSRELELDQLKMLLDAGVNVPADMLVEATSLKAKDKLMQALNPTPAEPVMAAPEMAMTTN